MSQLPNQTSRDYELFRWLFYIFIGGAVNGVIWQIFADFLYVVVSDSQPKPTVAPIIYAIIGSVLVYLSPIGLSLALTRIHPQKRIVPPLYMQVAAFAWFMISFYNRYQMASLPSLYLIGTYAFFGGMTQDRIASSMLGRAFQEDNIISYSLKVDGDIDKIRDIIMTDKFRKNLNVGRKVEQIDSRLIIRSFKKGKFSTIIELKKGLQPNETLINEVFFEVKDYYVTISEDLQVYADFRVEGLKKILTSPEYNLRVEDAPKTNAQYLMGLVEDEMEGLLGYTDKMTKLGWVKIVAFAFAVGLIGVFAFVLNDQISALTTAAIVALYLAFELPSKMMRTSD